MFKGNNNIYTTPCSSVSINNLEHVIAYWVTKGVRKTPANI